MLFGGTYSDGSRLGGTGKARHAGKKDNLGKKGKKDAAEKNDRESAYAVPSTPDICCLSIGNHALPSFR